MELKTKVHAEEGKQDLTITRGFDLPLGLLFKAYVEPEIVEQWMGTRVLKHESKKHGAYQFETSDREGNVVFKANGVIHELVPDAKITRTFEMENAPYGVQLEFLKFEDDGTDKSKLTIHVVYESNEQRDNMLKLPFSQGINWAHNRLEEVAAKLKKI